MVDDHGDRVPEAEEEDEERVVHVAQMALSPQLLVLLLTAIKRGFFFFFFGSDSIRLMRKIVFVFQIFQLCFVFLFLLWYVLPCNR